MDSVLHRIEALPGDGRYAVGFRRPDGSEQSAVVQVAGDAVEVAEASLPTGWTRDGDAFGAVVRAVLALDAARSLTTTIGVLHDVDGGWDVSLGNVVIGDGGAPTCTAHGPMAETGERYVCAECGAAAAFA